MSEFDDLKSRLDYLESYIDNEISPLIHHSIKNTDEMAVKSNLQKFRPSKHKRAFKPDKNLKKRCYTR